MRDRKSSESLANRLAINFTRSLSLNSICSTSIAVLIYLSVGSGEVSLDVALSDDLN
jgi:hypothetical protein